MSDQSKQRILSKIAATQTKRVAAFSVLKTDSTYITLPIEKPIYKAILPDSVSCFKAELEAISGKCIICNDKKEVFEQLKKFLIENNIPTLFCRDRAIKDELQAYNIPQTNLQEEFTTMQAGITSCEYLIARTGSVMVSSAGDSGRQMNVFPPIHIIIANQDQLVDYPENALEAIENSYKNNLPSAITTITGPSRTADIEKTLVLGAHGPKELVVFLSKE
jgi:L-lactate dehydrogenase complex protein LldG